MQTESSPTSATASLGQRLRSARIARNLTIDDVSAQLKLPKSIVVAMEHDDYSVLGAAVYARGRFGNYARLLGIPVAVVDAQYTNLVTAPPALVTMSRDSRFERGLQRIVRQGIYAALTAIIVLPVIWLATHHQLPPSVASLTALDAPALRGQSATKPAVAVTDAALETTQHVPIAASMAPFTSERVAAQPDAVGTAVTTGIPAASPGTIPTATNIPANTGLQLRFSGDSWVELLAADGHVLERGVVVAGSVRNYQTGVVASVAIGNTSSVMVLQDGQPLDLNQFHRANVSRFTLSSDGKPAPTGN